MKRVLSEFLIVLFSLCIITTMDASAEVRLFGTIGYGGGGEGSTVELAPAPATGSTLVELDPDTGAIIQTIGPVGYTVNGLDYDPTNGTLYGGTAVHDPVFNGLITIDMTTGAGTPVSSANWGMDGPCPITNITVDSTGQMYAWSEETDSLVHINKNIGTVENVYTSYVGTWKYGLKFDNADVLYLVNGGGGFYRINTSTGEAFYEGSIGTAAHHGDFHPVTNLYYGLTTFYYDKPDQAPPRVLLRCDLAAASYTVVGEVGDLHTLAFIPDSVVIPECAVLYINSSAQNGSKIFVDQSASAHTIIHKGDVCHCDSVKFGGNTSICFDGKGDFLRVDKSEDWNFGQGNFTIDVWVNFAKITSVDQEIFTTTYSPLDLNGFYMRADNNKFVWYHRATGALKIYAKPVKGQWYHLAVTRVGNMLSIYVNGSREITSDCTGAKFGGSNLGLVFGKTEIGPVRYFNGYMDKIMVTKECAPPEPPPGP